MLTSHAMKKLIIGAALTTLLASPAFAQSYSAGYGTGNVINLPLAEQSNGAAGIGASAYNGTGINTYAPSGLSSFAYAPVKNPVKKSTTKQRARF